MSTPFSYQDKRVVVTGGTTGVGAALVDLLESLDVAHITVLDLKKPSGPVDTYLQVDLADPASIDAAIDAIEGPIDALFNNAGVAATLPGPTVMAVNYLALRHLSRAVARADPAGRRHRQHGVDRRRPVHDPARRDHRAAGRRRLERVPGVAGAPSRADRRPVLVFEGVSCRCTPCARPGRPWPRGCAPTACARRRSTRRCCPPSGPP